MENTDLLLKIEHLERLLNIAKFNIEAVNKEIDGLKEIIKRQEVEIEYWHMRASEAEDDRDRYGARLDEIEAILSK